MNIASIRSVAEAYAKMAVGENSKDNLAATDAELAQKKQEPMDEIPSWVPGNIPAEKKKEFAEAAKKAWESDNTQFDYDGRTYKITEKLVGDQDKLDVNGNGKIDAEDLAALRSGEKQANEHHLENEVETPGQTQYPGSGMKDVNGNGIIDGEDKADEAELDESVRLKKSQDMLKVAHGAMSMADYKKKWAHLKKPKNKLAGPGGLYKNLVKEGEENPTDKLTIDVPAMIRALEKAREDFKSDEDIHNFVQDLLKKKDATIDTNALPKNESVNEANELDSKISGKKSHSVEFDHRDLEHIRNFLEKPHHESSKAGLHRILSKHFDKMRKPAEVNEAYSAETSKHMTSAWSASDRANKSGSPEHHEIAMYRHGKVMDQLRGRAMKHSSNPYEKHLQAYNAHQDVVHKHLNSLTNESVNEKLDPHADAGEWISDFVHSKDPKFAGKSKEERTKQALAAYYQARRDAGIKESTTEEMKKTLNENIAGDPRAADLTTKANQASALAHSTPDEAGALAHHDAATQAHQHAADHYRVYANHASDPVLKSVAQIHHKFHSDMAHHHTMRGIDFNMMHRPVGEAVVNEGGPADAKAGPEVMDPKTKKMKDDAETKVEEAPYTNKADGSENVVPADKPKANPTPMPKLTKEQTLRSVADTYAEMLKK